MHAYITGLRSGKLCIQGDLMIETLARIAQTLRLADAVQVDLVRHAPDQTVARLALIPCLGRGPQQITQDDAVVPLPPRRAALVVAVVRGGGLWVHPAHGHAVARRRRRLLVGQVLEEARARVGPRQGFGGAGDEVVTAGGAGGLGPPFGL
ncbi:ATP-binding protein cassette subfamily D (ALD) member 2 [Apiospora arundinis]